MGAHFASVARGSWVFPKHWGTHGPSFLPASFPFMLLGSCLLFFCCWVCSPLPRVIDKVEGGRRGSGIEDEGLPWPGIGHVARFQVLRFPSMVCAKAGCLQLRRMRGTGCCLGHRSSCEHSSPGTWFSLSPFSFSVPANTFRRR